MEKFTSWTKKEIAGGLSPPSIRSWCYFLWFYGSSILFVCIFKEGDEEMNTHCENMNFEERASTVLAWHKEGAAVPTRLFLRHHLFSPSLSVFSLVWLFCIRHSPVSRIVMETRTVVHFLSFCHFLLPFILQTLLFSLGLWWNHDRSLRSSHHVWQTRGALLSFFLP